MTTASRTHRRPAKPGIQATIERRLQERRAEYAAALHKVSTGVKIPQQIQDAPQMPKLIMPLAVQAVDRRADELVEFIESGLVGTDDLARDLAVILAVRVCGHLVDEQEPRQAEAEAAWLEAAQARAELDKATKELGDKWRDAQDRHALADARFTASNDAERIAAELIESRPDLFEPPEPAPDPNAIPRTDDGRFASTESSAAATDADASGIDAAAAGAIAPATATTDTTSTGEEQ